MVRSKAHHLLLQEAMKQLNFSDAEKNQLLRVVAAILQLGNIVFGPNRDGSGSVVTNQDGTACSP
jgi:myosin heavy subunit